ncbi:MAG: glycosyl hydrolase repeat-containing glycosyl hydrolase, partial [Acidobacteria bacterium]|nr:glycosyl hydrolase repeat-containing glycosyl hydrolase [Acidobacteriota bacterium]
TRHITPRDGDVLLLVGTMKGAFLLRSDRQRATWELGGPYFPGTAVYALAYDGRAGRNRLWAGPHSMHWGALLRSSDDFGRTWTNPEEANVKFPQGTGAALKQVWQIVPGRESEPDTLYCGVEPAALFVSPDAGDSWSLAEGLWNHPQRPRWEPGGGGLCLHTILPDPTDANRLRIAVSTGGMYATEDGGATWRPSNRGVRAQFLPDKYPEFGQCVHKVAQSRVNPERMYLQNHWGLYRTDDRGESWTDIANGVPSDFGFALAVHPEDPDSAWIVPLESDEFRCTPEGKLRVYRTRDAGASWEPLTAGLPQHDSYETVLRDALAVDPLGPAGLYFGTRNGKLFASADEGMSWSTLADGLPPIVAVKTAVVSLPKEG